MLRMRIHKLVAGCVIVLACCATSFGWHDAGHKIIASIAFRRLEPAQREELVAILRQHPRFQEDFAAWMPRELIAEEQGEWIVQQAAVWPDLARKLPDGEREKYHRGPWHYLDIPLFLTPEDKAAMEQALTINRSTDLPADEAGRLSMNAIQAIEYSKAVIADRTRPAADRAIAICWLFHVIGDIHQPCHSTAMFSRRLFSNPAEGDRGGNLVIVVDRFNLHSVWDAFPGGRVDFRTPRNKAVEIVNDSESQRIGDEAAGVATAMDWLRESHELAAEFVYAPEVMTALRQLEAGSGTPESAPLMLSEEYNKQGGRVAQRRVIQAGYRLGAAVKAFDFGATGAPSGSP
jgi:hypothetical protein